MSTFRILARFSILAFFLGLISCWEPVPNRWAIKDITSFCLDPTQNMFDEVDQISGDSLFFSLQIEAVYVFAQNSLAAPFTNKALALSLPEPGRNGIFEDITSVEFFANKEINGIPAGSPINELVGLKYFQGSNYGTTQIGGMNALDFWMTEMNKKAPSNAYFNHDGQIFYLAIPDHPADSIEISMRVKTYRQEFYSTCNTIMWNN